jgi:hypothetical protein
MPEGARPSMADGTDEPGELKDLRKTCATHYDEHLPRAPLAFEVTDATQCETCQWSKDLRSTQNYGRDRTGSLLADDYVILNLGPNGNMPIR